MADDAIVENLVDLVVAHFGIIAGGEVDERLPAFADGAGDFALDLQDMDLVSDVSSSLSATPL